MIPKKIAPVGLALLGLAAGVSFLSIGDANAKGCNGVVSQLEWGCAAWDNNNGPQYPHYKKPAAQPAKPAPHVVAPPPLAVQHPTAPPPIATNGSGVVAAGGGNLVNKNASGVVAAGGGNLVNKNASGVVAAGGGNLTNKSGSGVVAAGGGN